MDDEAARQGLASGEINPLETAVLSEAACGEENPLPLAPSREGRGRVEGLDWPERRIPKRSRNRERQRNDAVYDSMPAGCLSGPRLK